MSNYLEKIIEHKRREVGNLIDTQKYTGTFERKSKKSFKQSRKHRLIVP